VGIDASLTSCGIFALPTVRDEWFGWSVATTTKDGTDTTRIVDMAQSIVEDIENLPGAVLSLTFEDYGPINKFAGKVAQRAELCGIIKYHALWKWKIPVIMVSPPSLKSFATGNGKASKDDMLKASAKFGIYPDTHDEADAHHCARLGLKLHRGEKTGASFHRVNP